MQLLDLPPELFNACVVMSIEMYGLELAMWMRLICSMSSTYLLNDKTFFSLTAAIGEFNQEVIRVLCSSIKFALSWTHPATFNEEIRRNYFTSMVLSDHKRQCELIVVIVNTLTYIFDHQPTLKPQRRQFTQILCAAAAKHGRGTPVRYFLQRQHPRPENAIQHVLAAAVSLKLKTLVYEITGRQVKDYKTEFGSAVEAAVGIDDIEMLQYLLDKGLIDRKITLYLPPLD